MSEIKKRPMPIEAIEYRDDLASKIKDEKLRTLFVNCYSSALETTIEPLDDGTWFAGSGDIHPMWLRDAAEQMFPYIPLVKNDGEMRKIIKGLLKRCWKCIEIDPYANAFHEAPLGTHLFCFADEPETSPWVWERKYEVDSLCFPLYIAYRYWKTSGDTSLFDGEYFKAVRTVIDLFTVEQRHDELSPYYFIRKPAKEGITIAIHDKLRGENGKSNPTAYTGMTWTGFIGSDDSCVYNYNLPENVFAVSVLKGLGEIFAAVPPTDKKLISDAERLCREILNGIRKFCVVNHEKYGKIYAYETDGLGNYRLMDDCNVPSMASVPLFVPEFADDEIYKNTRRFIFSKENPYYYSGKLADGIGSSHTPEGSIWIIGMAAELMTCNDIDRAKKLLSMFAVCDDGRGTTPESFDTDNPVRHTREWYPASDSMFAASVISAYEKFGQELFE